MAQNSSRLQNYERNGCQCMPSEATFGNQMSWSALATLENKHSKVMLTQSIKLVLKLSEICFNTNSIAKYLFLWQITKYCVEVKCQPEIIHKEIMCLQRYDGEEETAAFNAKGLAECSPAQLTAQLKAGFPPPKAWWTFCCSGVWRKDQVLLLKPPLPSWILDEPLFGNYVLHFLP